MRRLGERKAMAGDITRVTVDNMADTRAPLAITETGLNTEIKAISWTSFLDHMLES